MDSLPEQMKAVVIEAKGQYPVFKQIPVPQPQKGQVLVKIDSAPINPSDLMFFIGAYSSQKAYPCVAGFEGSGTVVQLGSEVPNLLGKRVSVISSTSFGTFAEYSLVEATACFEIDEDLSFQQAACTFVNPLSVIGMLEVAKGNQVKTVVHTAAASALGRMLVRYFQNNGIKVINVVRRQEQVDILKSEGAEHVLDQTDPDFFKNINELTASLEATVLFDAIGGEITGKILEQMPYGTKAYVYGGLSGQNVGQIPIGDLIFRKKSVQGFWLSDWLGSITLQEKIGFMIKLKTLLKTDLKSQISKEYPLEKFIDGVQFYKKNMSLGKVLFRPFLLD